MPEPSRVHDPFHLQRFVDAQADIFDQALAELRQGHKRSHWMWFIFPQIAGLGSSAMAQQFAISDRQEALAYLSHPLLGPRLKLCTGAVNELANLTAGEIFGYPDDLKFRSSITLFAAVDPNEPIFRTALEKYFRGQPDPATLARL